MAFNDRVEMVQDPTDKTDTLAAALRNVKPQGNTALYDAVIYASDELRRISEDQITRRAIVLISDGVDTVARSTVQQAENAAARAEVMIFSLSTNYFEWDFNRQGDAVLRELAASTGGALLPAHDERHLSYAFRNIEKALRNQYFIAYVPAVFTADGTYRTVELVPLKHGLRTNCRKGYYAKHSAQH